MSVRPPLRSIVDYFHHDDPDCPACHGDGTVCENHPDHPWDGLCCGGAGMPCPRGAPVPHPNDMTHWDRIACRRGCPSHEVRQVGIDLGATHGYGDLPQVPDQFARRFQFRIWDPDAHPVDGGPYCPAHDAVSETIVSHRIWEPRETILTLAVCETAQPGQRMADFGCQLGWFSLLAASCGLKVDAIDAELENLGMLARSCVANDWHGLIRERLIRVAPDTEQLPPAWYRLVKIDLEGAEADAIRLVQKSITAGLVDFLLVEVSPVFHDRYPSLVMSLVAQGYEAYLLPPKHRPPIEFTDLRSWLEPYRIDLHHDLAGLVGSWHQEDVVFHRIGAEW